MNVAKLALAVGLILLLSACERPDNAAFGARVRAYLLEHPEVIQEAQTRLRDRQEAELQTRARAALPRVRQALERDARDFVANPDGRITVTEFYDYRCPHCTNIAPHVLDIIHRQPDVRFVFKEMPIFGGVSDRAAMAALAVRRAGGDSLGLYGALMESRDLDAQTVDQIATAHGAQISLLDDATFVREVTLHLGENAAVAQEIGITGTPGFVIGDTIIYGEDNAGIDAAIAAERRRLAGQPVRPAPAAQPARR